MIRKHVLCSCFYPPANTFLLLCRQDHFKYMTCISMWEKKQNFCILFTFCGFWSVFHPSPWKCLRRAQTNFSHGSVMYHTHEVISSYFCLPCRHWTPPRRPAWLTASSSLLDFASPYWNIFVQWWSKKRSILENWRKRWHRELLIWVLSTGWETTISVHKIFLFYFASVQKGKKRTCEGVRGRAHGVHCTVNIISICTVSAISIWVSWLWLDMQIKTSHKCPRTHCQIDNFDRSDAVYCTDFRVSLRKWGV